MQRRRDIYRAPQAGYRGLRTRIAPPQLHSPPRRLVIPEPSIERKEHVGAPLIRLVVPREQQNLRLPWA